MAAPVGAVATVEGVAEMLSITHSGLTLALHPSEVKFLQTMLSVVCKRQESSPSWTADNLGAVKAGHLIVSAATLLTP
jgi:hypothetical protein